MEGVLRIRPNGAPEKWIKPGAFGSASVLGVLVDEPSNTLVGLFQRLVEHGVEGSGGGNGKRPGQTAILKTGTGKVRAAFPGEHNLCNDMAIGADGSAFT